jgi:transposase
LLAWARGLVGGPGLVAVEDVRHLAGSLVRDLLAAGEQVVLVPRVLAPRQVGLRAIRRV